MKSSLMFFILLLTANLAFAQTGTKLVPPALIEGFATITSAAGTTTLTRASETKQIVTGSTTQTVKLPDATTMSKELGRRFYIINKSSGNVTLVDSGSNTLATIAGATQVEAHLRAAGSANGTWDILASSGGGGGGSWGSITGTLSSQTDLQSALDLKAPLANPTFTGTITTPLVVSKAVVTNGSGALAASGTSATQVGYLSNLSQDVQTSLDAKTDKSTLTTAGDIYVATASATTTRLGPPAIDGRELVSDSAATKKIRYKAPLVDNFIKNGDAESTNIWTAYADAAGTRPVDCTGGSPNVTTSTTSSSPLADVNSFTFVKDAANRQGQGWSAPFTIPIAQQAKVLQIELPYIVSSGTFVAGSTSADSDVIWYIYDVSNSQLIEPSSIKMLSNSTTISDRLVANFQTSATGTSYRLCAHVATTSASAYTLKADDVHVKPSQYVYGTPITDWVSYTPTGGWTGAVSYAGKKRRVGDVGEYWVTVTTSGAPTGTVLSINQPSGETIDTSKLNTTTSDVIHLGTAKVLDSGVQEYGIGYVKYTSTTSVTAMASNASTSYLASASLTPTVPITFGASDTVDIRYSVPIVGWSSSTQVSDGYDGRLIAAQATTSSQTITAGGARQIVNASTVTYDKTNSVTTGASWKFTAPSQGLYELKYVQAHTAATYTTGSELGAELFKNGSVIKPICNYMHQAAVSASPIISGSVEIELNAGDYIDVRSYIGGSINATINGATIYISKKASPTTISATEVFSFVGAGATTAATGGGVAVVWKPNVIQDDTHGCYNASTGECTVRKAARYKVSCQSRVNGSSPTANQYVAAQVVIDGSYKSQSANYIQVGVGVTGYPSTALWQGPLTSGQKITCAMLTNATGSALVTTNEDTRMEILEIK